MDNTGNVLMSLNSLKWLILCYVDLILIKKNFKKGDTKEKRGVVSSESGLAGSKNQGCPRGHLTSIRMCHSLPTEHAVIQI